MSFEVIKLTCPVYEGDQGLSEGFTKPGHPELGQFILFQQHWNFLRPAIDKEYALNHRQWLNGQENERTLVA